MTNHEPAVLKTTAASLSVADGIERAVLRTLSKVIVEPQADRRTEAFRSIVNVSVYFAAVAMP